MKIQKIASNARHRMHKNRSVNLQALQQDPEIRQTYIGCTTRLLTLMSKHYCTCRTSNTPRHNVHPYRFIREHGGWNDWSYEILETIELTTIQQCKLKRHYIEKLKATLDTYLPTRTDRERKINARRRARYAKQQQSQQLKAIPVYFV